LSGRIHCPAAEQEEQQVYDSPAYKELELGFKDLLETLGRESGIGPIPLPFKYVVNVEEPLFAVVNSY
jgi:hypothetical protein